jgi:hypothetical protein
LLTDKLGSIRDTVATNARKGLRHASGFGRLDYSGLEAYRSPAGASKIESCEITQLKAWDNRTDERRLDIDQYCRLIYHREAGHSELNKARITSLCQPGGQSIAAGPGNSSLIFTMNN